MEKKINFNIKECFKNSAESEKKQTVQAIINTLIKKSFQH